MLFTQFCSDKILDISTELNSQLNSTEVNFYWTFRSHLALNSSDTQSSTTATIASSFPPEMTKPRHNENFLHVHAALIFSLNNKSRKFPRTFTKVINPMRPLRLF